MKIGSIEPVAPVVLAPMAGVTNAPFRTMCRSFAPGLVYVNEMVMATAVVHGNAKTERMMTFAPDEQPRSLQLYGSDPVMVGAAVRRLCDEGRIDHLDMNFGCPAAKVTRRGGGAAVPAKPNLLRAIVREAVRAASPYGVPVTIKFRKGLFESLLTHVQTGRIAAEEGVAAIALHARTAEQHYAGTADWDAIAELKAAVPDIPVLGNGDIWEAADAVAMMRHTNCDGVVVGRGCLGRPWLFRDLVDALAGGPVQSAPLLGEVCNVMAAHARLLAGHLGENLALSQAAQATRFAEVWKENAWNSFRLRVTGDAPKITLWINDVQMWEVQEPKNDKIAGEVDGFIGLQLHWTAPTSAAGSSMGPTTWKPGGVLRFRNLFLKEL